MGIRLQIRELLTINQALKTIIDDKQSNVDALLKFKLLGIMKEFQPHVENFEFIRNEKIVQYGQKTKRGNYQITKDNKTAMDKFKHDIDKILMSEVSLNIEKLKASCIFDKGVKAEYLIGLYPIIEQ